MMRRILPILVIVAASFASWMVAGSLAPAAQAAPPQVSTNGSPDPDADNYSPVAWIQVWDPTAVDFDAVKDGDLQTGMRQAGLVVPELFATLSADDRRELQQAWQTRGLLRKVWDKASEWRQVATNDTANVPLWSRQDADWVAQKLGGRNYADLSPGLKAITQRAAMIVTGDKKPPMPDGAWQNWMSPEVKRAWDARPDGRFQWSEVRYTGSVEVVEQCDAGSLNWLCNGVRDAAGSVAAVIDFADDPLGWAAQKAGEGASALIGWIGDQADKATTVDLSSSWWLDAYSKGFAVGICLMLIILLWQFQKVSRGKLSSQELVESVTLYAPGYFAGVIFGPPLAQFLIRGASALTNSIVESMFKVAVPTILENVAKASKNSGDGAILGGALIALILLLLIIVSCIVIFVSLAVQAAAVYMAGSVFGIAFAWIVAAHHRGQSLRIPVVVLGIIFARPLLFFMLGGGLGLVNTAIKGDASNETRNLAMLIMAVVVLALAAFAPLLLLKFAPGVMPGGAAAAGTAGGGQFLGSSPGGGGGGLPKLLSMSRSSSFGRTSSAVSARDAGRAARGGGSSAATAGGAALLAGGAATGGAGAAGAAASGLSRATRPSTATGAKTVGELRTRFRRGGEPTPEAKARYDRLRQGAGPGAPTFMGGDGSGRRSSSSTGSGSLVRSGTAAGSAGAGQGSEGKRDTVGRLREVASSIGGGAVGAGQSGARGAGAVVRGAAGGVGAAGAVGHLGKSATNSVRRVGEDLLDGLDGEMPS